MKSRKKEILTIFLMLALKTFSNGEVPNTIIRDNPQKEVPIIKLEPQRKRPAELNIKVKKLSTTKLTAHFDEVKNEYNFILPEKLGSGEGVFVTDNLKALERDGISRNILNYKIEGDKIYIDNLEELNELYIIKYIRNSRELVKLYRWDKKLESSKLSKEHLVIKLSDDYIPYKEIKIDNSRTYQGVMVQGIPISLPEGSESVDIYNLNGQRLRKIEINSGNGEYGLQNNKNGINLNSSNGYVNLGVGFEAGKLIVKVKEWSSRSESYGFIIKSKGTNQELEQLVEVVTIPHKVKILSDEVNLNFGYVDKNSKEEVIEHIESIDIQVPSNVVGIKNRFSQGNILSMKKIDGEDRLNVELEVEENSSKEIERLGSKIKSFDIKGKLNKNELRGISSGTYTGRTELIIEIDG